MLENHPLLGNFFRHSSEFSDSLIISETRGGSISAGDLARRVVLCADNLKASGFKPGDKAVVMIKPGIDLITVIFGIILVGGVIVVAEPYMGQDIFESRMGELQPEWVFAESILLGLPYHPLARYALRMAGKQVVDLSVLKNVRYIRRGSWIPGSLKSASLKSFLKKGKNAVESNFVSRNPTEDLLIVFTSGTTSSPKMVVHTFGSVQEMLKCIQEVCRATKDDIFYTPLPHFLLLAVSLGIHAVIPSFDVSARERIQHMYRYRPTMLFGAPVEFLEYKDEYAKKNTRFPDFIKKIFIGSAPVTREFLNRFMKIVPLETEVSCIYGMTEALPVAVVDARRKILFAGDGDLLGTPVALAKITISDDKELHVEAPHMFSRYWGMDHAKKVDTGDLVETKEGELVLVGRKKDMIIRRDVNIYPALYESTIEKISGIRGCALVGVFDEAIQDEKVFLFIEPEDGYSPDTVLQNTKSELEGGRHAIDRGALPDFYTIHTLPRIGRQRKIDKNALREEAKKMLS